MKSNLGSVPINISFPNELSFFIVVLTLLLIFISNLFNLTNFWVFSVTALLLPVVFTYATGLLFMRIVRVKRFDVHGTLFRIVSFSLIGLVINGSLFFSFGLLRLFTSPVLIAYFASILIFYIVFNNNNPKTLTIRSDSLIHICIISTFSLGVALWFQPPDSFPNLAGWDTYTHMLTVRTILVQHGISELNLPYLPVIHYFYAAESILTNVDPFSLYWGSIYFVFPISGVSLYLLGQRLSGDKLIGIGTGIFGITIGSTNEVLGFIFSYSSTYGLIIMILANTVLLTTFDRKFGILYIISSILVYYPLIVANFIILTSTFLYRKKRRAYYVALTITVLIFVVGLYFVGPLLGGGGIILSSEQMWQILKNSYVGERGLILVLMGVFFMYYRKAIDRRIVLIWISSLTILLVMISGSFVSAYRLEEFIRPYISFIIGYGLGSASILAANLIREIRITNKNHKDHKL